MRRVFVVLVSVLAIVGLVAPQAFAQAAAPAPKVTINGYVDFASTAYTNLLDSNITSSRDNGWFSRERGRIFITGEVGKTKGVIGWEMDFVNGQQVGTSGPGGNSGLDLDTDVKGQIEVKWLYLETPITGAGSLLPFIPVATTGRFGGQPMIGQAYKPGVMFAGGDFGGITLSTTWAPNLRSTLTYAQIDEALDPVTSGGAASEDFAILASVEVDVMKGLTVTPRYAFVRHDGGSAQATGGSFGTECFGGFCAAATNQSDFRHTIGGDVKWTAGRWSLQPTFLYQWGEQEINPAVNSGTTEVDINSWLLDIIGGFRQGPLTIEARVAWTPGDKANECPSNVSSGCRGSQPDDISVFRFINSGFIYWAGWAEAQTSGVDYNAVFNPGSWGRLGLSPSYDKYGRISAALAVDYALTPALTFHLIPSFFWTSEKVDIDGTVSATTGITPRNRPGETSARGDERYLGNEWDFGFTYVFAPNIKFDLIGAVLLTGDAYDRRDTGKTHDAENIYKLSTRFALTW